MSVVRLVILGAGGRMGRTLVKTIADTPGAAVVGAVEQPGSPLIGQDAGVLAGLPASGVKLAPDLKPLLAQADGILDFTLTAATVAAAALAAEAGVVHVVGTTGLSADDMTKLKAAAARATIMQSGNMSLGVNVLAAAVRRGGRARRGGCDVEMHHNKKIDAPSGTALLLGQAAAQGRNIDLDKRSARGRDGITGARKRGDIGFASLRGGTVVGDHSVIFAGAAERLELTHKAEDRMLFARGAVKAALWAHGKPPGLYSMADVLGLADF